MNKRRARGLARTRDVDVEDIILRCYIVDYLLGGFVENQVLPLEGGAGLASGQLVCRGSFRRASYVASCDVSDGVEDDYAGQLLATLWRVKKATGS